LCYWHQADTSLGHCRLGQGPCCTAGWSPFLRTGGRLVHGAEECPRQRSWRNVRRWTLSLGKDTPDGSPGFGPAPFQHNVLPVRVLNVLHPVKTFGSSTN